MSEGYTCRTCGGAIKVSATLSWSAAEAPPTWEGPWVHLNHDDWVKDVHPAQPREIQPPWRRA